MLKRLLRNHERPDGLIRVDLTKGSYLLLTVAEYANGLMRGKRERRQQRFAGEAEKPEA
jgi:hypothetical protein